MIREFTLKRLIFVCRGLAQSGSAPALGAGCREFESLYPDHFFLRSTHWFMRLKWFVPVRCKAPVAQLDRASAF